MSKRTNHFKPGWKMTLDQHNAYWYHLGRAAAARGLTTAAQREELREQIHMRAFGENISAKQIDHLKMFDDFKAECLAIYKPTDLGAQKRQVEMPLIRLREGILQKFDEDFILSILRTFRGDRFANATLETLETMSEKDLTDLRNTLCARESGWRDVEEQSDLAGEEHWAERLDELDDPEHPLNKAHPVPNDNPF